MIPAELEKLRDEGAFDWAYAQAGMQSPSPEFRHYYERACNEGYKAGFDHAAALLLAENEKLREALEVVWAYSNDPHVVKTAREALGEK